MQANTVAAWDNKSAPGRCGNTTRGLTRSLDLTKEGLAMKATRICTVDTCDRPRRGCRPYCNAHLRRLERTGDLMVDKPIRYAPTADERDDIAARIMQQSRRTERGCIEWTGLQAGNGYGHITWKSRQMGTHRAIWIALVGEIPKGKAPDGSAWTIDHLCSNRLCVNVGHLEVVSRIENTVRGGGLLKAQRANRKAAARKRQESK
jgi:hypothetical protein